MDAAEIVVRRVQCDRRDVVIELLGEAISSIL
jgi:hypothetical protein